MNEAIILILVSALYMGQGFVVWKEDPAVAWMFIGYCFANLGLIAKYLGLFPSIFGAHIP